MINLSTILKHNVIGKLLNHLVVFLINVMIVRSLGAGESGYYFNELYILNFIAFIFSAGLDYASIAIISKQPGLASRLNRMLLKIVIIFICLVALYSFILLPKSQYFRQPAFAIILFSTGNLLLIFFQGILSALKKFNLQNIILGITNLLFLGYLVFFMKLNSNDEMIKIANAYAVLFFLQGLLICFFSFKLTTTSSNAPVRWSVFLNQGIYIMFSSLVYFAFLRVDNFFVEKYDNGITLGNYVQCGKVGQYFLYFSSIISSTLLPFIATETIGASFNEWKKLMKPYIILLCLAAIFIAATGSFLFPAFFGKEFADMNSLMIILLPGFVCLGMLTLLNAVYIGKGNIRKIFIGDVIGLTLVLSFDSWLVPKYGAYAAAIISSSAYCIVFVYLLAGFKKQFTLGAQPQPAN